MSLVTRLTEKQTMFIYEVAGIPFLDLSAFLIVFYVSIFLFASQGGSHSGFDTVADAIVPVGIGGALLGLIAVLAKFNEITVADFGLAMHLPLLTLAYSLIIRFISLQCSQYFMASGSKPLRFGPIYKIGSLLAFYLLVVMAALYQAGSLYTFIDLASFIFVFLGLGILIVVGHLRENILPVVGAYILPLGMAGSLIGITSALYHIAEPSKIGPAMAFAFLTLAYCLLIGISMRLFSPLVELTYGSKNSSTIPFILSFLLLFFVSYSILALSFLPGA